MSDGAATDLVGQVIDGRYRIERVIGTGGMSVVYLAIDERDGTRCAVKVLSASLASDTGAMDRLRREAELGAKLSHRNVCHIRQLIEMPDGAIYVVMPLIDGELLCDRRFRVGSIPLPETVKLVRDVAAGLHVLHELKIVHRDLKPENIMVCKDRDEEFAVVMDFGLADERGAEDPEEIAKTGVVLGTPAFMSPEQLKGKPLDPRTDIYSLALVTYEMLTGRLPFDGRTQHEVSVARIHSSPIPIRALRPDLKFAPAVERVLLRALDRNPRLRYATAPGFADALADAAGGGDSGGDQGNSGDGGGDAGDRLLAKMLGGK